MSGENNMKRVSRGIRGLWLVAGCLVLADLDQGQAEIVAVQWGGPYVTASTNFADSDPLKTGPSNSYGDPDGVFTLGADSVTGRAYRSTPFSPSPLSGYSGTSATFYGGGMVTRSNSLLNDGFNDLEVLNQGSNDSYHFHVDTGGSLHTFHALTFWDKADFLNSLNLAPNLYLTPGGQFSLTTAQSAGHHTDELLRWVVRDGSQFYVSEATSLLTNNASINVPYSSLTNWKPYSPNQVVGAATISDLLSLDFDESPAGFSPQTFNNVTGLGFYIEHESSTGPVHVHIENFSATAAVPEPSALALTLVGMLGLVRRRQRR
jgi:hypothetical protein